MSIPAAEAAARGLIQSFGQNVSPRAHSVWVRTEIDNQSGDAVSVLMVARNPQPPVGSAPFSVPEAFNGFRVKEVAWGRVYDAQ